MLPGHGAPITDADRLVRERIAHHDRRKQRILEEIRRGPISGGDLVARLWPGLPPDQLYLALSEVLGHVDLLVADGAVAERTRNGRVDLVATADDRSRPSPAVEDAPADGPPR